MATSSRSVTIWQANPPKPESRRREESRRRVKDLVGPAQFGILLLQPPDRSMLLARQPGRLARVHLGRADHLRGVSAGPLPRRLATADSRPVRGGTPAAPERPSGPKTRAAPARRVAERRATAATAA